ncbi:hypothetical protein CHH28_17425 [Bacterioplanes sanyensis]|uniref:Uncharacterized protein n=1 Tax=Bacterioplanes sanyensis TaxID=1249553 RepID=A0A222FMT8_9GAMM|nr:hypothetical protein [Bacterioplanes sanyensis]ASP40347.1 hypothetical protein CHH28_17425 [Bacterioplanes sanyensis]
MNIQTLQNLKQHSRKALLVTAGTVASTSAFANTTNPNDTAITQAFDAAKSMVTSGSTGLISVVAVLVGVGIIVGLMKKS